MTLGSSFPKKTWSQVLKVPPFVVMVWIINFMDTVYMEYLQFLIVHAWHFSNCIIFTQIIVSLKGDRKVLEDGTPFHILFLQID